MKAFWTGLWRMISGTYAQAALIASGGILVASSLIVGQWRWLAIGLPVGLFAVLSLLLAELGVRLALPKKPVRATRLLNVGWLGWVGCGALLSGIPLWGAAELPDTVAGADEAKMTVVSVVAGLAVLEALKKVALDEEAIEKFLVRRWKSIFRVTYAPKFADRSIDKYRDVPKVGKTTTRAYDSVYFDGPHGGWGPSARVMRAQDIQDAL